MTAAAVADSTAREYLRNADPVLARVIDAHPDFRPRAWIDDLTGLDAFGTLTSRLPASSSQSGRPARSCPGWRRVSAGTCRRRRSCSRLIRRCFARPGCRRGRTSSEIVADLVAGARVVKAANTLSAEVLASDPHQADGQRVIFISGDNDDAKAGVLALFKDAGFAVIDLGNLATGGAMQQIHHPLAGVNLIRL